MQKIIVPLLISKLNNATASPRRRKNYNFHQSTDANYQRMLNCLMPDTYCRPHKHTDPVRSETFIILKGKALVVEFGDAGMIIDSIVLDSEKGNFRVDLLPDYWHTIIAITPCVVFEAKEGPYIPLKETDFAPWAPAEGTVEAPKYNTELKYKLGLQNE